MTAVTSHQCLPELIHEMPPGHAKDIVLRLCGHTDRSVYSFIRPLAKTTSCTALVRLSDIVVLILGLEEVGGG